MLDEMRIGLQRLTPQELAELDAAITPRVAELMLRVSPDLEPLLKPFFENDAPQPQPGSAAGFRAPGAAPLARMPQSPQT